MAVSHTKLRSIFTDFWKSKNHKEVPAISLVPQNDPTTLFTGSGMQQFVPNLLGEPHPLGKRLFDIQRSFRSQDIEEIGNNRHTTMFEMLGNWSLGDYFKEEQISWLYDYLINKLDFDVNKLHFTIFGGTKDVPRDDESEKVWIKMGVPQSRIYPYVDKNWWSRAGSFDTMPAGEAGGPDTEVFYDYGESFKLHEQSIFAKDKCHPNCDCGRFVEIANSVFIQYRKTEDNKLIDLPAKNVDFGGGLERQLVAHSGFPDIFLIDLHKPALDVLEGITGKKYSDDANKRSMRIITDHMKAATFLMWDGVRPSNKEQGYVLRRLMRRSAVKLKALRGQLPPPSDVFEICKTFLKVYEGVYFDVEKDSINIKAIIEDEMSRFSKTLDRGLKEIEKISDIDGKKAFDLYQTFGFPLEVTEEIFTEKGQQIDHAQFAKEFDNHKNLSRTASAGKFKGGLADHSDQVLKYHTATHLLHQALFDVLGDDIRQEGSNITAERLRFDFYSSVKPAPDEVQRIEDIVNEKVAEALPMRFKLMPKEEAYSIKARSFFRDKYPDTVKVYYIGGEDDKPATAYSKEFCGGPHVTNTKEIGRVKIQKIETIGSNLYRIYMK